MSFVIFYILQLKRNDLFSCLVWAFGVVVYVCIYVCKYTSLCMYKRMSMYVCMYNICVHVFVHGMCMHVYMYDSCSE